MPDPQKNSNGTYGVGIPANSKVSQSVVLAAAQACRQYAPTGLGVTPAQQAKNETLALKFAVCMRAHGVTNFPDPSSNGAFKVSPNSGLDQNSPTFQAAAAACRQYAPAPPSGAPAPQSGSRG